jgi:hypothetical protein
VTHHFERKKLKMNSSVYKKSFLFLFVCPFTRAGYNLVFCDPQKRQTGAAAAWAAVQGSSKINSNSLYSSFASFCHFLATLFVLVQWRNG